MKQVTINCRLCKVSFIRKFDPSKLGNSNEKKVSLVIYLYASGTCGQYCIRDNSLETSELFNSSF